jgi:hypothetical protein
VRALAGKMVGAAVGLILLSSCVNARATLVAIAPSRDGLVIAADSRLTFLGAQCDGAFKILAPARPLRTVAVITGASAFVAPQAERPKDVCRHLMTAPRVLDMNAVVLEALARTGDDASRISMEDLSGACIGALEKLQATYPGVLTGYEGREIVSVVVASFDPVRVVSTVRRFVVRLDAATGRIEAIPADVLRIDRRSARDVWVYGETDWVNRAVYSGAGRRFLKASTLEYLEDHKPVGEVPLERAVDAAANVITAASHAAKIEPPPSGIGGEIHVMVIGRGERAVPVMGAGKY